MAGIPQIGALPGVPSAAVGQPSGLTNLFSAIASAPDEARKQNTERMQAESQQQDIGRKLLATIQQRIQADPTSVNNPQLIAMAQRITQQAGLPSITQTSSGGITNINADTLPGKTTADLDLKTLQDLRGLPPQERGIQLRAMGVRNVDPDFETAPMVTSLNPTLVNAAHTRAQAAIRALGAGQMTPAQYIASIKAEQATLGPDASQAFLDPSVQADAISAYAQAKIQELHNAGIYKFDQLALRQRIEADVNSRFAQSLGLRKEVFVERQKMDASTMARNAAQIARTQADTSRILQATREAPMRLQLLQTRLSTALAKAKAGAPGGAKEAAAMAKAAQGEYDRINGQVSNLESLIGKALDNGGSMDDDNVKEMVDRKTQLENRLTELQDSLTQADAIERTLVSNQAQAVTGMTAKNTASSQPQTKVNPKNGKTYYLHADGNYYPTP